MLFSTTSLATIGVVACTAVGLLFAPFGEAPPGDQNQSSVQLQGVADSVSADDVVAPAFAVDVKPVDVSGSPFAEGVSEPFDSARPPVNVKKGNDATGQSPQGTNAHWASGNADFYKRVEQALAEPVRFNFIELPLIDAITEISQATGLPVRIDEQALDEHGMTAEDPVDLEIRDVSLESALNLIVSSMDLTYTVDNEIVTITSPDFDEDKHQLLRIYWAGETGLQATPGSVELIQTLISPRSWEPLGGVGNISILAAGKPENSALGIRTSYTTHRKIERFLQSIKAGSNEPMQGAAKKAPVQGVFSGSGGGGGGGGGGGVF